MLTVTHGQPTEQQIIIVCGIAAYLIAAPLFLAAAALCGRLSRPTRPPGQTVR